MRERIRDMRKALVDKLAKYAPNADFRFILEQRGMFSYTGLTAAQVARLRASFQCMRWTPVASASQRSTRATSTTPRRRSLR
jgi:aspartate/tyrosine/aromatic aminotransferase